MEVFAGLSVGVLLLVALLVAIETFTLWHRTRGLPELLLGLYLSGATVLGYPLTIASSQVPPSNLWLLHLSGQVAMSAGFACLLLFTMKVFRPDALWARCLVGVEILVLATGTAAYYLELTGVDPRPAAELLGINLLTTIPIAVAYFWATFESLSYHRQLRLRLSLGLAEIAVVNRVLLWGLMTLAAGIAVIVSLGGMLVGSFMSAPLVLVLSGFGLAHAVCLFLAFHPPLWYRAWLERPATAQQR